MAIIFDDRVQKAIVAAVPDSNLLLKGHGCQLNLCRQSGKPEDRDKNVVYIDVKRALPETQRLSQNSSAKSWQKN